jgi:quinoprotein glucose dehydrogenase
VFKFSVHTGSISAIDLTSGQLIWSKPLGTARDTGPLGIPSMLPLTIGPPNSGGSVVTRGGLVFVCGTAACRSPPLQRR